MFEDKVSNLLHQYKGRLLLGLSLFLCGFLCHGYMLLNKIPNFDDAVALYVKGLSYTVGRWFLPITAMLTKGISIPLIIGTFSIVFIIASAFLICDLFDVTYEPYIFLIGCIMLSFPTVTGTFTFMFTADAYFLSLLFVCAAIRLLKEKSSTLRLAAAIVLICCSIGIYQAYFDVACALALLYFMFLLAAKEKENAGKVFGKGVLLLAALAGGMVLYLLVNRIVFFVTGIRYQASSLAELLHNFPKALVRSYREFFSLFLRDFVGVSYCKAVRMVFVLAVVAFAGGYEVLLVRKMKKTGNPFWFVLGNIAFVLLPVACNAINFAMINREMDTLMVYSYVLVPILPFFIIRNFKQDGTGRWESRLVELGKAGICLLMLLLFWQYALQSNRAYLGMDLAKQAAASYFTTMITEIKMTEGYHDEMPVAFVGEESKDRTVFNNGEAYRGDVRGTMNLKRYINMYSREWFMGYYCGFLPAPYEGDKEELMNRPEVVKMPCYPDEGSVAIVDGVLIVKIGDETKLSEP